MGKGTIPEAKFFTAPVSPTISYTWREYVHTWYQGSPKRVSVYCIYAVVNNLCDLQCIIDYIKINHTCEISGEESNYLSIVNNNRYISSKFTLHGLLYKSTIKRLFATRCKKLPVNKNEDKKHKTQPERRPLYKFSKDG